MTPEQIDLLDTCRQSPRQASVDEIEQLVDMLDAAIVDARRYRYLRATTNFVTSNGERIDVKNNPELWDAVLDAEIAKNET